jgi:predicted unusual protein kinase regulating ubiquinone biosynthesis (AarF/ABC1/UbiB family)
MAAFKQLQMSFPTSHHVRLHDYLVRYGLMESQPTRGDAFVGEALKPAFSSLRSVLQEAGDVCSLFGLYLSTRIDLLSLEGCIELSRISDTAPGAPWADVEKFVEQELSVGLGQAFLAVEPMPYETSLLLDSYIAMLDTGENVSLRVLRREFRSFPAEQLDALRMLRDCRLFQHWTDVGMQEVIDDFTRELRLRTDQLEVAAAFEALAVDAAAEDGLWAPRTLRTYCRRGILALEQRPSVKLSSSPNIASRAAADSSAEKAARIVCVTWMRRVFHGRVFPVQFGLNDVSLLEDGRVAFVGGTFTPCSPDSNEKIWKYLLAAAADDPDECCRVLLDLMTKAKVRQAHEEVLAAFRQSVTCFMSAPGQKDFCSGLAARILRQLQIATEAGYHPRPFLILFYRGLFSVLAAIQTLQPQGDPLLEALEGVWVMNIFGSARRMVSMDALGDIGTKYLAAMIDLPIRLDAVLSNVNHGTGDECAERAHGAVSEGDPSHPIAIALVLTAVLLLVRDGPIHFAPVWIDRISFSVCCVIGLLVLRVAARP